MLYICTVELLLSVTRRDKIHEGASRVFKGNLWGVSRVLLVKIPECLKKDFRK